MNLEQVVSFDLRLTGPCTQCHNGPVKQIYSIEDLAEYTHKYPLHMNIPYTIVILFIFAINASKDSEQ